MIYQLTASDWLILSGLAVNSLAFWLMFRPTPKRTRADSDNT
jgi:hypothetical protein